MNNGLVFPHILPPERLGTSHASLEDFEKAILPFSPTKFKHFTLVIVTEPLAQQQRILLGIKQRGFGKGMYNSFGGKVEEGEDLNECASRELLEETGIHVEQQHMATCHVGELRFSFNDSDIEMVVHVFRVNITTMMQPTENGNCEYMFVDPSSIRPCEEIIPEWFDSYENIPLDNMFADDSLWLTKLLELPPKKQVWMRGHFFFEPGGQDVNTIRHYYLEFDEQPPPKRRTLEQQLFHQLHIQRIHNPSIKEFKEAFAFAKAVQKPFRKLEFDVVLDVAGGHGALAALLLMLLPSTQEAVVIDPAMVGNDGVQRAWGRFYSGKTLRYRHECLRTGLPAELQKYDGSNVLVVACHACQHLSEEVLQVSCSYNALGIVVMPCCQRDTSPGCSWKSTSKNLDIPIAKTMDILLAGRAMGWSDARHDEYSYDVRIKAIDESITPQNRIIMCKRVESDTCMNGEKDVAHEKLERAYRKAHHDVRTRACRTHIVKWTNRNICWKSLATGVTLGAALCVALTRRR